MGHGHWLGIGAVQLAEQHLLEQHLLEQHLLPEQLYSSVT
jgi:hypothetical protein